MSVLNKSDHQIRWIACGELHVEWAQAQRGLRQSKVDAIRRELDPDAFGVLTVAELNGNSKSGGYHIIDGQHRHAAILQEYGEKERVPCEVIAGVDTPAQAAKVWLGRNTLQTKPTPLERFQRMVVAGDVEAAAVDKIVRKSGFVIGSQGVQAVTSCVNTYRRHGEHGLSWVLDALSRTWGKDKEAVAGDLINGYANVYGRFGGQIDLDRLASVVSKRYTPANLLGAARGLKDLVKGGISEAIMTLVVRAYNTRLAEDKQLGGVE